MVTLLPATEAIFEFPPGSRDMSPFLAQNLGPRLSKNCSLLIHILAPRMKFKNRLGAPKSNQMRGLSPKNEPTRPRGLGCRGGASDLEAAHTVF